MPPTSSGSPRTTRHLCLTDFAETGWETHGIAAFAGHWNTDSTLQYIHLSDRELTDKLSRRMEHRHARRIQALAAHDGPEVAG